jgi:cell division protein FtsB
MLRWTLFWERLLPIAILATAAIGVPVMILAPPGLPRLRALSKELADVEQENASLRLEVQQLRGKVQHLRDDPTAVERIARDELGLVRSTEVVFQFPRRP